MRHKFFATLPDDYIDTILDQLQPYIYERYYYHNKYAPGGTIYIGKECWHTYICIATGWWTIKQGKGRKTVRCDSCMIALTVEGAKILKRLIPKYLIKE